MKLFVEITKLILSYSLVFLLLFACTETHYPEYKQLKSGAQFKYELLGDDAVSFEKGDTVSMRYVVSNLEGDRLVSPINMDIVLGNQTFSESVDEILDFLDDGDSVSVLLPVKGTLFETVVLSDSLIKLSFSIHQCVTPDLNTEEKELDLLVKYTVI